MRVAAANKGNPSLSPSTMSTKQCHAVGGEFMDEVSPELPPLKRSGKEEEEEDDDAKQLLIC